MTQISNFKIYYFNGLTTLKQQNDYLNYLIILKENENGKNIWYQFRNEIVDTGFEKYLSEKLQIEDEFLSLALMYNFNYVVSNKSYDILNLVKVKKNVNRSTAYTDRGITINDYYEWGNLKRSKNGTVS